MSSYRKAIETGYEGSYEGVGVGQKYLFIFFLLKFFFCFCFFATQLHQFFLKLINLELKPGINPKDIDFVCINY